MKIRRSNVIAAVLTLVLLGWGALAARSFFADSGAAQTAASDDDAMAQAAMDTRPAAGPASTAALPTSGTGSAALESDSRAPAGSDAAGRDVSVHPTAAATPRSLAAYLDTAPPEEVRVALAEAVAQARRARRLEIAPSVIETAASTGEVRVVFSTPPQQDPSRLADTLESGGAASSVDDLRVFPMLGHGAAKLTPGALYNLITETPTEQIEPDEIHRASLLESVPQVGATPAHALSHDGDGFAVAVIDTGVDAAHDMFGARVIEEACFSIEDDCPNGTSEMFGAGAAEPCALAGCDHGTHVAGIAVGDAASGPIVGVAPHAALIAINVFSDIEGEPGAYTSDILAAMQHVLGLAAFHDIASVNLSLGGEPFTSTQSCDQDSPAQRNAVAALRGEGIATVVASGNESFTNALSSPGCLSNVISVGSVGDADAVSSFSNSASFLSVLSPGESIQSAAVGGGTRNGTGTSMATPHVAGAIAAIREAVPGASVAEIENAIALSGLPILDARNGITTPRLRVDEAIALLEAAGPPTGIDDDAASAADDDGGGGGGGCGLVGVEPFLVLALVRRLRGRRATGPGAA